MTESAVNHPARIRPGQAFFPRQGQRRQAATVRRVKGESIQVLSEDGVKKSLPLDRLLATRSDGSGSYYQYLGFKSRPGGYRTVLEVIEVNPAERTCVVLLPEWNAAAPIKQPLSVLPGELSRAGATGSCLANLAAKSIGELAIHGCGKTPVRGASREAAGPHPKAVAKGQRYMRRADGLTVRLLDASGPRVRAWNGRRVVRISNTRLLETSEGGTGRYYEYLGGGVWETRRARGARAAGSP